MQRSWGINLHQTPGETTAINVIMQKTEGGEGKSHTVRSTHLVDGRVGAEPVIVLIAFYIPHEHSIPLLQDHRQRVVVVRIVSVSGRGEGEWEEQGQGGHIPPTTLSRTKL